MGRSGQPIMLFPILLRFALFLTYASHCSCRIIKETEAAILSTLSNSKPAYIRLGKHAITNIHSNAVKIDISKASVIKKGKDLLLLATGETVQICLDVIEELQKYEVIPTIVSVPTIRSLDNASVLEFCKSHRSVIVCEEQSINGGLREAIARLLM